MHSRFRRDLHRWQRPSTVLLLACTAGHPAAARPTMGGLRIAKSEFRSIATAADALWENRVPPKTHTQPDARCVTQLQVCIPLNASP